MEDQTPQPTSEPTVPAADSSDVRPAPPIVTAADATASPPVNVAPTPQTVVADQSGTISPAPGSGVEAVQTSDHVPVKKKLILVSAVLLILIIGALGFRLYYTNTFDYTNKTVSNGGYSYSFSFTNAASSKNIKGSTYLFGYALHDFTKVGVIAKPTADLYSLSCGQIGSNWNVSFRTLLYDSYYPVCTDKNLSYSVIFPFDSQNQLVEVFSQNGKSTVNSQTVQAIIDSLRVTK